MTAESREPSIDELFDRAIAYRLSNLRSCLPCKVLSYDKTTQTADLLPMIKQQIVNGDGQEETLTFPVIPDVPVSAVRFGPYFIHASLPVDSFVLCVFSDASLEQYRATALSSLQPQDPLDLRQHHIADAIALPLGVYGDLEAIDPLPDHLVIGFANGGLANAHFKQNEIALGSENPVSHVALATLVSAQLTALNAVLTALGIDMAAIGLATGAGASTAAAIAALQATGWPASVAATKVKAE